MRVLEVTASLSDNFWQILLSLRAEARHGDGASIMQMGNMAIVGQSGRAQGHRPSEGASAGEQGALHGDVDIVRRGMI